jgi:cellulase/cellobiase CelA1
MNPTNHDCYQALSPALTSAGFPATFIVDQGRAGVQNIRQQWGDWCNIKGAGFGTRPTTNTGSSLIDSIVWVKPGGECDGTSNSSSPRYDSTCSLVSRYYIPLLLELSSLTHVHSLMLTSLLLRLVPGSRNTSRLSFPRPTPRYNGIKK